MKSNKKQVWVGSEDLKNDVAWKSSNHDEFPTSLPEVVADANENMEGSRRDFLKILGFSVTAAAVASCEIPVKKAIPYVIKPEEIVPGVATYYASSYVNGGDYCPIIVKTREGRPIKIEGNKLSSLMNGGTSARAQACVLSLYDSNRFKYPASLSNDELKTLTWTRLDSDIREGLNKNDQIRIVSHTNMSPTFSKAMAEFMDFYPNAQHVSYDPISSAGILIANEEDFGKKVIPGYHFDKAGVIVSFNADFLGTWISGGEYSAQYAKNRKVTKADGASMSRHIQIESGMSLTGSNADNRILVKPSEQGAAIAFLYNEIAKSTSGERVNTSDINAKAKSNLSSVAKQLLANKGNSLIISASNNVAEQKLINAMNHLLGNYGHSIEFHTASNQKQGDDRDVQKLLNDMQNGSVDALFVYEANPVFELPNGADFASGMKKLKTTVALGQSLNETFVNCAYVAPTNHLLEDWGDVNPKRGTYSFIQPTISPLFKTRNAGESFLNWCDSSIDKKADQPYFEYLKANWIDKIGSQSAFDNALQSGVLSMDMEVEELLYTGSVSGLGTRISKPSKSDLEISFFETVNMGSGQFADNPWLMELPDPVTRCVWGNYVGIHIKFDGDRSFESFKGVKDDGELISMQIGTSEAVMLPVVKQFGQMEGTLSMALGYGRVAAGPTGAQIGHDMFSNVSIVDGLTQYYNTNVTVGERSEDIETDFACVQHHHTLGVTAEETSSGETINADEAALIDDAFKWATKGFQGSLTDRSILRHTNLDEVKEYQHQLIEQREEFEKLNSHTLYPYEDFKENLYDQGHHWGMHIDMNSCTGCGSCVVACMAENNVPVVGKKEVMRHHEMTWLKIDRYYYGDVESPNVAYQPMLCQHCDNAPCENVCPVNATNHSSEGLNQMAYNRCIGTRYCANNCPYKLRRFNWLDYTANDLFGSNEYKLTEAQDLPFYADNLTRMVLNPDVTVRTRGVIEKCSFCVQRLQEGKLTAKTEGRRLSDDDIQTACQSSCTTKAITFGDTNNKKSAVSVANEAPLNYIVLEEINVRSSITYSAIVNNKDESFDA